MSSVWSPARLPRRCPALIREERVPGWPDAAERRPTPTLVPSGVPIVTVPWAGGWLISVPPGAGPGAVLGRCHSWAVHWPPIAGHPHLLV